MRCMHLLLLACLSLALTGCLDSKAMLHSAAEHPCGVSAYVELRNDRNYTQTLAGWTYQDDLVRQTLPTFRLAPGETFRVWRGAGQDDDYNVYLGQTQDTWNFSGVDMIAIIRPDSILSWGSIEHHWFRCSSPSLSQ
ncbi:MAG: lamin tail domain-containing protein [Candidatus Viridilinea halotolerans]|uniref:Lamin tail domain-containing protein n=1 Tax=Candidatus Viridilinea halotolerans TaxID=2491704 RepID=A0A426U3E9_9CHLR|nr:MAG: lamin tail domain-containing protein [Candidatus Viridilinea halotolerans]